MTIPLYFSNGRQPVDTGNMPWAKIDMALIRNHHFASLAVADQVMISEHLVKPSPPFESVRGKIDESTYNRW